VRLFFLSALVFLPAARGRSQNPEPQPPFATTILETDVPLNAAEPAARPAFPANFPSTFHKGRELETENWKLQTENRKLLRFALFSFRTSVARGFSSGFIYFSWPCIATSPDLGLQWVHSPLYPGGEFEFRLVSFRANIR